MIKAIYKITNKKNNKVYIGQTIDVCNRWIEHKNNLNKGTHHSKRLLEDWITYGEDSFFIAELFKTEHYDDAEILMIARYNATNPDVGYNVSKGGSNPPIHTGENSHRSKHTNSEIDSLIYDLRKTRLSFDDLAIKYNYADNGSIQRINMGYIRRNENEIYPIRDSDTDLVTGMLLNTTFTQSKIAKILKVARSMVTMINIGHNGYNESLSYPLRCKNFSNTSISDRNKIILEYILDNEDKTAREVSDTFKVSIGVVTTIKYKYKNK